MAGRPVEGRIIIHPRGFGFVDHKDEDGAPRVAFVAPPVLNAFLEGDRVSAVVTESAPGRHEAKDVKLLERTRTQLFGTIVRRNKTVFLEVDRQVANTDWPLDGADAPDGTPAVGAIEGDRLRLIRTMGAGSEIAIERVIARHGLRAEHPPEIQAEAARIAKTRPVGHRQDLRSIPTITIDAPHSRDLDDALAVVPAGPDGGLRVLVSIADVDAYVAEGSPVDLEARRRGTSVYLAGRVLPMLPEILSNEAISLNPGFDRPAMTVELRIDPEGGVTSVDVYASVIRSHARLSYDAVGEVLKGNDQAVPAAVLPTVRWLRTAVARLGVVRAARGGIQLLREEAAMSFEEGEPTDVTARVDDDAHRIVERLMVAANEAVAEWLVERGLPGTFRVHPEPEAAHVARLSASAARFGFETGFGPTLGPRGLAAFEAQLAGSPSAVVLQRILGRVLGPARYTVTPGLHFGLAAPLYLHFTSPIRRYADLVVHRIIKKYLAGNRTQLAGDPAIETLAVLLNDRARVADKAEQDSIRMLAARLYATRIGEEVSGAVIAVKPFGLVVQIANAGVTGTVATEALGEDVRVDLANEEVTTKARTYSLGDTLALRVSGANESLGRIELLPR
jgi:ribonuclease R